MKSRLTFANVVSLLALVLALAGGAYAAGLARNSVKSKQIKDGAVKTAELADGSVTSPKIADGALQASDFAAGQLPKGATGPQGPAGTNGTNGTNGTDGTDGDDGSSRAYVWMEAGFCGGAPAGTCPARDAKNVTSIHHIATGRYCITVTGINGTEVAPVVAVDFTSTAASGGSPNPANARAMILTSPSGCPNTGDFEVATRAASLREVNLTAGGSTFVPADPTDSDNVGFSFVVP